MEAEAETGTRAVWALVTSALAPIEERGAAGGLLVVFTVCRAEFRLQGVRSRSSVGVAGVLKGWGLGRG